MALTSSIEFVPGSALMVRGLPINNRLTDFALVPGRDGAPVANRAAPGMRPPGSLAPTVAFDANDQSALVPDSPGRPRIVCYAAAVAISVSGYNLRVLSFLRSYFLILLVYTPKTRAHQIGVATRPVHGRRNRR